MPVIRVNAVGETPKLHRSNRSFTEELARKDLSPGPVIIMLHGYKYQPGLPLHCPHSQIMALHPCDMPFRPPSWPRQLGFGVGHQNEGLAIAFGWQARGLVWQAHRSALRSSHALAEVIGNLRARRPSRPIHVIAHSMGTSLILNALRELPAGSVQRIISMTGACYQSQALEALETPAGRTAEFINVTSRENDAFDFMYEWLISPPRSGDRAIGHGLTAPNAVTLQIDSPETLALLDRIGTPVDRPERLICHWSSYTRRGMLRCYNELMRRADQHPLSALRRGLPRRPDPRWSRLIPRPHGSLALPFQHKAS